ADLRRGDRLLVVRPLRGTGPARLARLDAARGVAGEALAGGAHPAVRAARADARRASARLHGNARDVMHGTARAWLGAVVLLAALPWIPGLHSDSARSLLTQMGIAAVFALSYNLLLGETGLLSFGHAVYFGLGGYASIHLMSAINAGLPIPMPLVPLAGALAGLAFGIVFGALTTRRGGTIFALISLGVGELVHAASLMIPS